MSAGIAEPPRVLFVTRTDCHLCDRARPVVADACARAGVAWAERDVDDDPLDAAEYGDRVPVVLVDGDEFASLVVDGDELAARLHG